MALYVDIPALSGGFGSDVLVPLTNGSGSSVTSLQLTASLTTATAGAETAKWLVKLISAGSLVTALDIRPTQTLIPSGSVSAGGIAFQARTDAGIWYDAGSVGTGIGGGGNGGAIVSSVTTRFNRDDYLVLWGSSDNNVTIRRIANGEMIINGNAVAFGQAALATNFTTGYLAIPSCAGTPSGVPANIPTGQVPIVYDSTNNKLAIYNGAWKQTAALT